MGLGVRYPVFFNSGREKLKLNQDVSEYRDCKNKTYALIQLSSNSDVRIVQTNTIVDYETNHVNYTNSFRKVSIVSGKNKKNYKLELRYFSSFKLSIISYI